MQNSLKFKNLKYSNFNKNGGVAQMVERSLSMREVPGSIPGASNHFAFAFAFIQYIDTLEFAWNICVLWHHVKAYSRWCGIITFSLKVWEYDTYHGIQHKHFLVYQRDHSVSVIRELKCFCQRSFNVNWTSIDWLGKSIVRIYAGFGDQKTKPWNLSFFLIFWMI